MSGKPKIYNYQSMRSLVQRLRDDLKSGGQDFVLLYAYNGTGKTRLSMAFKEAGKKNGNERDTLYFNAYTEDLFYWDNDLSNDTDRQLRINFESRFFSGFKELALEEKIFAYLERYADFDFKIDYENWIITFSRQNEQNIKVSRGEQNIFIWCIFLAICELAIDNHESYAWVRYLYIDDPISSLDDNNAIAVASDLAKLLRQGKERFKTVISTHHSLFHNVIWNELRSSNVKYKTYFYHRPNDAEKYTLQATDDTPFFHHVAMLSELQQAANSGKLYTHHFNMLRSILEKTATFFGFKDFSACIHGVEDEILYARALNLLSHGKYSIYEPREMVSDTKELFKTILAAFLGRYRFDLPGSIAEVVEGAEQL
jgi:AAA domain